MSEPQLGFDLDFPNLDELIKEATQRLQHGPREALVKYYLERSAASAQVHILEQMAGFLSAEGVESKIVEKIVKRSVIIRQQYSIRKRDEEIGSDDTEQGPKYRTSRRQRDR